MKLFQENNNSISIHKHSRKKNSKKNNFQNFYKKSKNEYSSFLKHEKRTPKNKNIKEKIKLNFDFTINVCFKIAFYLIMIFIFIQLKKQYDLKILQRYEYRYKKILQNNRTYDESNLTTFEDKLNWLAIHDSTLLKAKCADKVMLHKYSKFMLGKDYCNKIIKVYDNAKEINFTELPQQLNICRRIHR